MEREEILSSLQNYTGYPLVTQGDVLSQLADFSERDADIASNDKEKSWICMSLNLSKIEQPKDIQLAKKKKKIRKGQNCLCGV
jgi:hypothetical protein